jgi:hypothetical protein
MNSDSPQEAGATPAFTDQDDACVTIDKDGNRAKHGYHHFSWIWDGPNWTSNVRCTTCGIVRENTREEL